MGTGSTRYRALLPSHLGSNLTQVLEDGPLPPGALAMPISPDLPPSEFDEEEIAERAAQAEEAALWAILDGADTVLGSSDINDIINPKFQVIPDEDVDMA